MRRVSAACQSAALCVGGRRARESRAALSERGQAAHVMAHARPLVLPPASTALHCAVIEYSYCASRPPEHGEARNDPPTWMDCAECATARVCLSAEGTGLGEPVQRMRTATKRGLGQRRTFGVWCVLPARSTASSEGNHSPVEQRNKDDSRHCRCSGFKVPHTNAIRRGPGKTSTGSGRGKEGAAALPRRATARSVRPCMLRICSTCTPTPPACSSTEPSRCAESIAADLRRNRSGA